MIEQLRQWVFAAAAVVAASLSGGCNIVGPASYIISGPPSVDAEYELADVPTVVFIDDRHNVVNPISLRRAIADKASEDLMMKKILAKTISGQDAMTLATQRERNNQIMSIEDIGKAVGAKQVIYVEMLQFQDILPDYTPRPTSACRVRVIDVENRKRMYPAEDAQEPSRLVQASTREVNPELYRTRTGRVETLQALAITTGEEIGKLFYKHEIKQLGSNLYPK